MTENAQRPTGDGADAEELEGVDIHEQLELELEVQDD